MIRRILASSLPAALMLLAAIPAHAQMAGAGGPQGGADGSIVGTVRDDINAMTLPRAPVEVVGTDIVVFTDLDGNYSIDIVPGTYQVRVAFPGYQERTVENVQVTSGQVTRADVVIFLQGVEETVLVTAGEPATATQEAQLLERKRAGPVMDNIGSEQMSANNDGDAASAVERVTGLSVVDSSYVFVRGLGARYSNSTLNGTTLPTTEPDKRVVPLDLFPTGMIDNVQVIKSYSPDQSGEFSGGLVRIDSLTFPTQRNLTVSMGSGGDSQTVFEPGLTYEGGDRDGLGFDDGTRELPSAIPGEKVVRGGIFTDPGFLREELADLAGAFNNEWTPSAQDNTFDQSYSVGFGDSWEKVALVASYSYKNEHHFQTEDQQFFRVGDDDEISVRNDYDFEVDSDSVRQGLVGNFSIRPSPNHKILVENFWTHNASDETRIFEGFNDDFGNDVRSTRLRWIEEDILSNTVTGSHFIPSVSSSRLEWFVARSEARRDEPDIRETLYEESDGVLLLADESRSGLRQYIDQNDEIIEGGVDWSLFFDGPGGLPTMLKLGPQVSLRNREFSSRQFRLRQRFTQDVDLSLPAEQLFVPENFGIAFELNEETRPTDTYNGSHDILSFYGMVDLPVSDRVRIVGGVRVERSEQDVETFDVFDIGLTGADRITTSLDDTEVLPGVNVIFALRDDMNLRFGGSQTVNRPQFRELAPFEFTDVVGGRATVGNPDLISATIRNLDVRWEMFPGPTEVLALSFFFKDFQDPIERVVEPTAQLRTSYANAESARNVGFELEAIKRFSDHVEGGANFTYVDSSIEIGRGVGQVQTSTERALAGTSEFLFNGFIQLQHPGYGFRIRGLLNYFDDRITDVGSLGLPDIFEEGREQVDIVAQYTYGQITFRGAIENLTDAAYRFTQGGRDHRVFRIGRELSLGVSVDVH